MLTWAQTGFQYNLNFNERFEEKLQEKQTWRAGSITCCNYGRILLHSSINNFYAYTIHIALTNCSNYPLNFGVGSFWTKVFYSF